MNKHRFRRLMALIAFCATGPVIISIEWIAVGALT